MRRFANDLPETAAIGTVGVARWEKYSLGDVLPFQAMWYTVPPGGSPPQDCHPEVELSIVISGTATVEVKGKITDVPAGSAFLLDSREAHIVHNRSRDIPLMVFSAYWMPR